MKTKIKQLNKNGLIEIISVVLLMFIAYIVTSNNIMSFDKFNNSDVHRGFQRAVSISQGVNPYLEFNPNLMLDQEKVPGFFPLYFYAMAILARLANYSFATYLDILRWVVFLAYTGLGLALYLLMRVRGRLLSFITSAIFLFNRWTVDDVIDLKQDTYVLLLLVVSLSLLKRRTKTSFLLYGIATGIKHLTVLALPVYIFELYLLSKRFKENFRNIVLSLALSLSPLIIPSIPFLIQSPENFTNALLYNGTRVPETSGLERNSGLNKLFVLYNQDRFNSPFFYTLPRIPLAFLIGLCITALIIKRVDIWQYCALAYLAFIAFNPVLYGQYFTWVFVFIPFLVPENGLKPIKSG